MTETVRILLSLPDYRGFEQKRDGIFSTFLTLPDEKRPILRL